MYYEASKCNRLTWKLVRFSSVTQKLLSFISVTRKIVSFNSVTRKLLSLNSVTWKLVSFDSATQSLLVQISEKGIKTNSSLSTYFVLKLISKYKTSLMTVSPSYKRKITYWQSVVGRNTAESLVKSTYDILSTFISNLQVLSKSEL